MVSNGLEAKLDMDSAPVKATTIAAPSVDAAEGAREAGIRQYREDDIHHDPLLDCLVELTRIHGRPSTRAALSGGRWLLALEVSTPAAKPAAKR